MNDMGVISKAAGTRVQRGGRVVVPAELRKQMGLQTGTDMVIDMVDGAIRIRTVDQVIEHVQAMVRKHVPEDVRLSDELLEERRREAAREAQS